MSDEKPAGISPDHRRKAAKLAESLLDAVYAITAGNPPDLNITKLRDAAQAIEALDRVARGPL